MAYFAKLDELNIVQEVISVNNDVINNLPFPESEPIGVDFCHSLYGDEIVWKQTSYNATFRKNYANPGYTYDAVLDAFIAPQPGINWTLNVETGQWESPAIADPVPALLDGSPPEVI
jgi:hypothetical protein